MSQFQIIKYKKQKTFEVLVIPKLWQQFKEKKIDYKEVLYSDQIFTSQSRGEKAKTEDLK